MTYLQFEFSGIAWGQAKNPKDEHDTFARLSQSELHVVSHQNLPQSKDVEVLLLFVGGIGNFIVSYLICMFQDSVPAGSYNDPFLSSVCDRAVCERVVCESAVCDKERLCVTMLYVKEPCERQCVKSCVWKSFV